ncbi:MAG: hypothetical protein M1822_004834 [Bathelium mastoideum]|nr:MAG: hypothetical protein M1822_004834 [Bathelium mastoideum]
MPYLLGALLAATEFWHADLTSLAFIALLLVPSFLLRSAGCVWNDAVDYELDRQVPRSMSRPVARGSISPTAASFFFVILISLWLAMIWLINPAAIYLALPNVVLVIVYPYAKRFTDYPQAVLGITLAWGVGTGYVMASQKDLSLLWENSTIQRAIICIALAYLAFTIFYDTIYAYQDVADDRKAGIRSTALAYRDKGKRVLGIVAILQECLLFAAGWILNWGICYASVCVCTVAAELGIVYKIDLTNPKDCALWFKRSLVVVSVLLASGMVSEWLIKENGGKLGIF